MFVFVYKVDAETALYTELWRACAGPLVTVPREGELVYYFPQGHIEQVCFSNSFNPFSTSGLWKSRLQFHFQLHC